MKKRRQRYTLLIFLFILLFTVLNMIIFPLINKIEMVKYSFILIIVFWSVVIATLYVISRKYSKY